MQNCDCDNKITFMHACLTALSARLNTFIAPSSLLLRLCYRSGAIKMLFLPEHVEKSFPEEQELHFKQSFGIGYGILIEWLIKNFLFVQHKPPRTSSSLRQRRGANSQIVIILLPRHIKMLILLIKILIWP
jgi:hypothetical protein